MSGEFAFVSIELSAGFTAGEVTALWSLLLLGLKLLNQKLRSLFQEVRNHLFAFLFPEGNRITKFIDWNDFSVLENFCFHVDLIMNTDFETTRWAKRDDVLRWCIVTIRQPKIMDGNVFHFQKIWDFGQGGRCYGSGSRCYLFLKLALLPVRCFHVCKFLNSINFKRIIFRL